MFVCLCVCMCFDQALTEPPSDVIFGMLNLERPGSVIGYIIFTSLFIKGQQRSKTENSVVTLFGSRQHTVLAVSGNSEVLKCKNYLKNYYSGQYLKNLLTEKSRLVLKLQVMLIAVYKTQKKFYTLSNYLCKRP